MSGGYSIEEWEAVSLPGSDADLPRWRELTGERDALLLVGADLRAVDLAGEAGEALVDHAAHDLAVLEQAGDVGKDFEDRIRRMEVVYLDD